MQNTNKLSAVQLLTVFTISVVILIASVTSYQLHIEQKVMNLWAEGDRLAAKGEYLAAIEQYDQALKLREDNLAIYFNRAEAYLELKLYNQALNDFEFIIRNEQGDGLQVSCYCARYSDDLLVGSYGG